jgi:hypothetical protein
MGDANSQVVVPGGPIPVATPGFDGSTPVPSFGQSAATPDPSMQVNNMAKAIMQRLAQASQRKQFAGAPVPAAVPGMQDPNAARKIGMDTANPNAWGKQRLMNGIATNISNAVAKQKQQKLLKAEADWTYMGSALNELYAAQAGGDPKAVAAAQQKVDVVMGDPKKLKEMAKALNQDWLAPEKTTVYGEALKKVAAKTDQQAQQDQQKQQAATGLKGLFQKLLQKNQQPQLTDDQKKAMRDEIIAKAPTSVVGGNTIEEQAKGAKAVLELEQASKAARENYQVVVGPDGKAWAVNKTNPRDAFQLRDSETGDDLKGQTKPGAAPKVASIKNVPYGVQRGGQILTPDSPGWTKDDQTIFDGAVKAGVQAQQLKIPTIVADEVGAPPNPDNYKNGTSDPAYGKALKEYGEAAEAVKRRMDTAAGIARAKASNDFRPVQVMNDEGQVYYTTASAAIGQGLAGASEGGKLRSKQSQMKDIETASGKAREAINNLKPGDFSPEQVALLSKAMSENDPGVAHQLMQNLAMKATNDEQQDFIIWITQLNERAMSLRNIAGMGAGAQDLRNAIRAMLPGLGSGNTKMMNKQLDAFDQQVRVLEEGVPSPGKSGKGQLVGKGSADMETQTYNGATYQRKKGSTDEWTLAPK